MSTRGVPFQCVCLMPLRYQCSKVLCVRVLTQAVYAYSACAEERRREATMRGGEAGWFRVVKGGSGVSMSGLHPPPLSLSTQHAHTQE